MAKTKGVMAGTARPSFDTDSSGHDSDAGDTMLDMSDTEMGSSDYDTDFSAQDLPVSQPRSATKPARVRSPSKSPKVPSLKLKIKLPPQPDRLKPSTPATAPPASMMSSSKSSKKRRRSSIGDADLSSSKPLSKKIRESLALNTPKLSPSTKMVGDKIRFANVRPSLNNPSGPGGTENEKLYCICRAPHDEVRIF